ncbi:hypothetical protein ACFQYP_32270 [Nonomuraea antimicrobica]
MIDDDPDVVFARFGSRYLPAWDVARTPGQSVADFALAVAPSASTPSSPGPRSRSATNCGAGTTREAWTDSS